MCMNLYPVLSPSLYVPGAGLFLPAPRGGLQRPNPLCLGRAPGLLLEAAALDRFGVRLCAGRGLCAVLGTPAEGADASGAPTGGQVSLASKREKLAHSYLKLASLCLAAFLSLVS